MIVLSKDYTIKNLNKKYDLITFTFNANIYRFVCNKGFIRKNTNLLVVTEWTHLHPKSLLRGLLKKYNYKLSNGQVTSHKFFIDDIEDVVGNVKIISNCWVFKVKDIIEMYPCIKKQVKDPATSIQSLFLTRDTNIFNLKEMNSLKNHVPFVKNYKNVKQVMFNPKKLHIDFGNNKDMRFYLVIGKIQQKNENMRIGKRFLLDEVRFKQEKNWFRKFFHLPAKYITVPNGSTHYLLIKYILSKLNQLYKDDVIGIAATISYDNVTIHSAYNLVTGEQKDASLCRKLAYTIGWYYAEDIITRQN